MRWVVMITFITVVSNYQLLAGQGRKEQRASTRLSVEEARARPDFGINYSQGADFKLASRKATYRLGEMIIIELAMMNKSNAPVFFLSL